MALTHYYAIYTNGNGASATIDNIKAGTGTGVVTSGNSSGHASGEAVSFQATGLSGSTNYDLEYVVSNGSVDTRSSATVNFRTMAATGSIVISTPQPIVRA